ncbi:MAG TPA: hypothetical protein VJ302_31625 [Blastocatellia bacterium]|nr:hypothetical protein [Blastocatellia bacterium]
MTKNYLIVFPATVVLLCAAFSVSFAQQTAPSTPSPNNCPIDGQQLKTLLEEMRLLRQEVRQISLKTHRLLSVSDQYARKQARVDSLTREIDRLKSQLGNVDDTAKDEEALKEIETALNETFEPKARAQLIQAHAVFKSALEKQKKRNEEFIATTREKLQQLEVKLGEEQGELSSLKDEMNKLNQELDRLAVERQNRK